MELLSRRKGLPGHRPRKWRPVPVEEITKRVDQNLHITVTSLRTTAVGQYWSVKGKPRERLSIEENSGLEGDSVIASTEILLDSMELPGS